MYQIIIVIAIFLIFFVLIFGEIFVGKLFCDINNLKINKQIKQKIFIKKIAIVGVMIAINAALSIFQIPIIPQIDYITISSLPLLVVGFMYGPLFGYITGILGNILYSLIWLHSTWNFGFVLSAGISGLIPGLIVVFFVLLKKYNLYNTGKFYLIAGLLLIELIFILLIAINHQSFILIENKLFHTDSIWANILFFLIGNLIFIEIITIIYFLIQKNFLKKFNKTILLLIVIEQTIRLFIISLLLDPLWLWQFYHINYTWIKIIKFPIELSINLIVAIPILYVILKLDNINFLSSLVKIYNKDNLDNLKKLRGNKN